MAYEKNNTLGYLFRYSYTNNHVYLDSIRIQDDAIHYDENIGVVGHYRFKYNDREMLPSSYLTTAIDHWGYYNGNPYNVLSIKDFSSFKSTRNPNFQYAVAGSLAEVQYPTGGVSSFVYEPNTYGSCQSDDRQSLLKDNGMGGGLRVKSITDYDSPKHTKILKQRIFEYNIPGSNVSSGELFATPKYYWPKWSAWCIGNDATHEVETFRTCSIIPLSNCFGPSLGYSYVTEKVVDLNNPQKYLQKTVYRYSNLSNTDMKDEKFYLSFSNDQPSPEDQYSEKGFKRGKLLSVTTYDGQDIKKESVAYKYRHDTGMNEQYTYTSNLVYGNNGCSASFGYYGGGIYKLYYPQYDMTEEVDSTFYSGKNVSVASTEYLKSDTTLVSSIPYKHKTAIRLLKSEKISRGNFCLQKNYDYGSWKPYSLTARLHQNYFDLAPQEVEILHNGVFYDKKTISYKALDSHIVPSMIVKTYSSGLKDTLVNYVSYTSTCQPLIYKEIGKPTMYLKWGYKDNYLLMRGTRYIPISFTDKDVFDEKACLSKEYSLIKSYGHITGYVYYPLFGILDMIYPNGYIKKYKYDKTGRLVEIYNNDGALLNSYEYNYRK